MNDDYSPRGNHAPVLARVILASKEWHPTKPGMLRFDAKITQCDCPNRVKIGGKCLSRERKPWLVGTWDSFAIKGNVTVAMLGMFDPQFDLLAVARAEGLSITPLLEPEPTA